MRISSGFTSDITILNSEPTPAAGGAEDTVCSALRDNSPTDSSQQHTVVYSLSHRLSGCLVVFTKSLPKIAPIRRAYNVVADNTGLSSFV